MSEQALVSILMTTYNHGEFLPEAIESILMQDYDNLQLVIADDCSTDGAQEIIAGYVKKYPEKIIAVYSDKNEGVTVNCNKALAKCSGKYILTFSGDDILLAGAISAMTEYMDNHPKCSICYANAELFDSKTGKRLYLYNSKLRKARQGDVGVLIKYASFNAACCTMVRSSKIPAGGYDERYPVASDWFFYIQTLLDGGEIHYINKILARYRRHERNITQVYMRVAIVDSLNVSSWIIVHYPEYSKEASILHCWQ